MGHEVWTKQSLKEGQKQTERVAVVAAFASSIV